MSYAEEELLTEAEALCPAFSLVAENLSRADAALAAADEMRICDLALAAEAVAEAIRRLWNAGMRMQEISALLSEEVHLPYASLPADVQTECMAPLRWRANIRRGADMATFAELLCRMTESFSIPQQPTAFLPMDEKRGEVAFVQNLYAEEAFDVFSQEHAELHAVPVATFSDAVELLRRGEVGYCLLPIEAENGMRLPTVESLIYQNDLKIVAATPVFGFDGSAELTYALIAQSFDRLSVGEEDDLYLECALARESEVSLSDVFTAAEVLGTTLYRTDTVTYSVEGERRTVHSFVLKNRAMAIPAFLWYVSLFAHDVTPIGLYKNLE